METSEVKSVYLIDSENVGDVWVTHIMEFAKKEDEIVVFYTQKSPYMSYENIRKLMETEREFQFVKCVEGQNALDFQLVTELGYRIGNDNEKAEYIVVTNDTGFDAAVRYWKAQGKLVKRYNVKFCQMQLQQLRKLQNQKELKLFGEVDMLAENPQDIQGEVLESKSESALEETIESKSESTLEETIESKSESTLEETIEGKSETTLEENLEKKSQDVEGNQKEFEKENIIPEMVQMSIELSLENNKLETEQDTVIEAIDELEDIGVGKEDIEKIGEVPQKLKKEKREKQSTISREELVCALLSCIGIKNIPDFHNALVIFLGDKDGKQFYKEIKGNLAGFETKSLKMKEKFKIYCQLVFEMNSVKVEYPAKFSNFVHDAKEKRGNLNTFRAALIEKYGKESGLIYYDIIKPHVKILNRMQNI